MYYEKNNQGYDLRVTFVINDKIIKKLIKELSIQKKNNFLFKKKNICFNKPKPKTFPFYLSRKSKNTTPKPGKLTISCFTRRPQ